MDSTSQNEFELQWLIDKALCPQDDLMYTIATIFLVDFKYHHCSYVNLGQIRFRS